MSQNHPGPVHAGLRAGHGGLPLLHHHDRLHLLQGGRRHAAPGTQETGLLPLLLLEMQTNHQKSFYNHGEGPY